MSHHGGRDRRARPYPLQAVDDDDGAGLEPALDDAHAVHFGTQGHAAIVDRVVGLENENEFLAEIGAHGAIVDENRIARVMPHQANAHEQSRRENPLGVGEHRAGADGAGLAVDLVVHEIELAGVRIVLLVGEPQIHRSPAGAVAAGAAVVQEGLLVGVEARVDRVIGDDGGEQAVARHQISLRDERARHAPIDGVRGPR